MGGALKGEELTIDVFINMRGTLEGEGLFDGRNFKGEVLATRFMEPF